MNCHICENKLTEICNNNYIEYSCGNCIDRIFSVNWVSSCRLMRKTDCELFYRYTFVIGNYSIFFVNQPFCGKNSISLDMVSPSESLYSLETILYINKDIPISINDDLPVLVPKLLERLLKLVILK